GQFVPANRPPDSSGGHQPTSHAATPLASQWLPPASRPVYTMLQIASLSCNPLAFGRSIKPKLAPASVERNSPRSVATSTTFEFVGSTRRSRTFSAPPSATGEPNVRPPSVVFCTKPPGS